MKGHRLNHRRLFSWLALWWKAKMHSERNVEIPRKEWGNPQKGIEEMALFWAILGFTDPYWSLVSSFSPVVHIYTGKDTGRYGSLTSKHHLTYSQRGFFMPKNWKGFLRVCLSLPCFSFPICWYFVWLSLAVQILQVTRKPFNQTGFHLWSTNFRIDRTESVWGRDRNLLHPGQVEDWVFQDFWGGEGWFIYFNWSYLLVAEVPKSYRRKWTNLQSNQRMLKDALRLDKSNLFIFHIRKLRCREVNWFVLSLTTGQWKYLQRTLCEIHPIVLLWQQGNSQIIWNIFATGRNNIMKYQIMVQNWNSHPTLCLGEQGGPPTGKTLHISTVQGNSTIPDIRAQRQCSRTLPPVGQEAADWLCLTAFSVGTVTSLVWRILEGTGPAVSFVWSITSLEGLFCFFSGTWSLWVLAPRDHSSALAESVQRPVFLYGSLNSRYKSAIWGVHFQGHVTRFPFGSVSRG